jgi:microcystin degradation protein MlrC
MHAHITPAMLAGCDALIGYQHYPHDDTFETGERGLGLLADIVGGRLRPAMRACRAPLIAPAQKQRTRGAGPMADIRARAAALETGVIRAISHFCVQPWLDLPGLGFTAVVVADGDADAAAATAHAIATMAWDARQRFLVETWAPADAIRDAGARDGFVVLADAADCVGGGASGDSAAVLPALLATAPGMPATMHIVDAAAAALAHARGVGARFEVGLGNRGDPAYGPPLAVTAEVRALHDGRFVYGGGLMRGVAAEMGPSAVLRVGAVDVLVASRSAYEYGDEAFKAAGIDPRAHRLVVVKNPMNYQQVFADAGAMYVLDTPGPTTPNLAALRWRRVERPLFPLDDGFTPRFTLFPERDR